MEPKKDSRYTKAIECTEKVYRKDIGHATSELLRLAQDSSPNVAAETEGEIHPDTNVEATSQAIYW